MKKQVIPALFIIFSQPLMAQDGGKVLGINEIVGGIGSPLLYVILGIAIILLILITAIYYSVSQLHDKVMAETNPEYAAKAARGIWERVFQVKDISTDKEMELEHSYDNIIELNNPIPGWFMVLFYITVVFGIGYILNYHVFKYSHLQEAEYTAEVEQAKKDYQAYLKKAGDKINPETVTLLTDAAEISKGKDLYMQNCTPCHGKAGEGSQIGPNLTDVYWLHGGGIKNVFKTITVGVPEKGMQSWKKKFSPLQIQQLSSFVISLQGSNPANAKGPQGELWTDGAVPAAIDTIAADTPAVQLTLNNNTAH